MLACSNGRYQTQDSEKREAGREGGGGGAGGQGQRQGQGQGQGSRDRGQEQRYRVRDSLVLGALWVRSNVHKMTPHVFVVRMTMDPAAKVVHRVFRGRIVFGDSLSSTFTVMTFSGDVECMGTTVSEAHLPS
jgi:hypothetical protein